MKKTKKNYPKIHKACGFDIFIRPAFNYMKSKNKRFKEAVRIHNELEIILLDCQIFKGMEDYPDIIDSLTRSLKSVNKLKITAIKQ